MQSKYETLKGSILKLAESADEKLAIDIQALVKETDSLEDSEMTKEDFQNLKYSDRVKIFNENNELYRKLIGGN